MPNIIIIHSWILNGRKIKSPNNTSNTNKNDGENIRIETPVRSPKLKMFFLGFSCVERLNNIDNIQMIKLTEINVGVNPTWKIEVINK